MSATDRPDWDTYFMDIALAVSRRGTCDRKRVGAIIVVERDIVATGYNGAAPGEPHCDEIGHDLVTLANGRQNCVRTVHAEENAFIQAARRDGGVRGGTIYTNTYPCWPCARMIISAKLVRVVYDSDYNNDDRVNDAFRRRSIEVVKFKRSNV